MAVINGTAQNDVLVGTNTVDLIEGFAGADTITGGGGLDVFQGLATNLDGDVITDLQDGERIDVFCDQLPDTPCVTAYTYQDGVLALTTPDGPASITLTGGPQGTFFLSFTPGGPSSLTFQAAHTISVAAETASLVEDGTPGTARLRLTLDTPSDVAIQVQLTIILGSAAAGDLTVLTTQVQIPAGSTDTVLVNVADIVDDALLEGAETFAVALSSPDQTVSFTQTSVDFTIQPSDAALSVAVAAAETTLTEDNTPGTARLTLSPQGTVTADIPVALAITFGSAAAGDLTVLTTQATIPQGTTGAVTVDVADVVDDALLEDAETFTVAVSSTDQGVAFDRQTVAFTIAASDPDTPTPTPTPTPTGPAVAAVQVLTQDPAIKFPWDTPLSPETVVFGVTFDSAVTNVDAGDFRIEGTGTASGQVTTVRVTGETAAEVVVTGLTGAGSVRLNLTPGHDIQDPAGTALSTDVPAVYESHTVNRPGGTPDAGAAPAAPFQITIGVDDTVRLTLLEAASVVAGVPFQAAYYTGRYPDVAAAIASGGVADAATHFATRGLFEGRSPTPLFDEGFYRAQNADVAAAVAGGALASGLQHYARFGAAEGRAPGPLFDPAAYLAANPDVAAAGVDPLEHFLLWGVAEGRTAFAVDDAVA